MVTFKPLDVYDIVDPDESLVEALREYPELREFEDVLTEGEEDQEPRETPSESVGEIHRLSKLAKPTAERSSGSF